MEKTSELIWQDTQHQELFRLIDELKDPHAGAEIFTHLSNYADHHFCLEEVYMRQLNYPHTEAHVRAHNQFRDELDDMVKNMETFDDRVRESISIFLREWLLRHVFGIDKDFEDFVLKSNVK
jgi:hemerythrin-like metal-binding protein